MRNTYRDGWCVHRGHFKGPSLRGPQGATWSVDACPWLSSPDIGEELCTQLCAPCVHEDGQCTQSRHYLLLDSAWIPPNTRQSSRPHLEKPSELLGNPDLSQTITYFSGHYFQSNTLSEARPTQAPGSHRLQLTWSLSVRPYPPQGLLLLVQDLG